eukprot:12659029-Heterocapsa_arctica.AAC.1
MSGSDSGSDSMASMSMRSLPWEAVVSVLLSESASASSSMTGWWRRASSSMMRWRRRMFSCSSMMR